MHLISTNLTNFLVFVLLFAFTGPASAQLFNAVEIDKRAPLADINTQQTNAELQQACDGGDTGGCFDLADRFRKGGGGVHGFGGLCLLVRKRCAMRVATFKLLI